MLRTMSAIEKTMLARSTLGRAWRITMRGSRVAERLRGQDVLALALDEHLAARQPRIEGPADGEYPNVGAGQARPLDRDDRQDQDDERERHDEVHKTVHNRVDPPAAVAGESRRRVPRRRTARSS